MPEGLRLWIDLESQRALIIDGASWENIFSSSKMPACVLRILVAQELGAMLAEGIVGQIFVGVASRHSQRPAGLELGLPQWRFFSPNGGKLHIYSGSALILPMGDNA
jgi:hypothetical protein